MTVLCMKNSTALDFSRKSETLKERAVSLTTILGKIKLEILSLCCRFFIVVVIVADKAVFMVT